MACGSISSCHFAGPDLPAEVVRAAFEYAQDQQLALAAFLGDRCATLQMHPELEVHTVSKARHQSFYRFHVENI